MASPEQTDTVEQQNATGVGALLKASRLRVGEELRDIAGILKIRHVYLEAIEDGRFEDLPGTTYTLGFVRAYAEHLGLDSGEVIRQFKYQESDVDPRSQLDFPEPIPEASVPGGAIIFIGVVVAVLAYGAWFMNSSEDGFFKDLIAPLPDRFAKMAGEPKTGKKAETKKAEPETAATEQTQPTQPTPGETQGEAKPTEPAQEPPPAQSQPETAQQPKPAETPKPLTEPVTEPADEPKPEKIAETTPETPKPKPAAEQASRIIVRAKTNSWIQVRDDTANELLLTRLLRAGDSYTVPGRSGLMLSTGNAGALEILVDGKAVPPIGTEGVVRRKILLDADKLKAGTAVSE